jgi:imidazolonepropionase
VSGGAAVSAGARRARQARANGRKLSDAPGLVQSPPCGTLFPDMSKGNADLLIVHASELAACAGQPGGIRGADLERLDVIRDGALAIGGGRILAVGSTEQVTRSYAASDIIDATGRLVSPGFVDPHSHLVFGGSRHADYESKVTQRKPGRALAGGIGLTARATRDTADAELIRRALSDLDAMLAHGTTTLEAKTGYGVSSQEELRLLRLTARLHHTVAIVPTFLPLHVVPEDYTGRRDAWIREITSALPQAARLARYCDVSCDPACFTFDECLNVGEAARSLGMKIRVHADQTGDANGAALAACLAASAADHLDYANPAGLSAMASSGTVATLLPGVALHLCEFTPAIRDGKLGAAEKPFLPLLARSAIEAGAVVALSTDYNPGSCPTVSMQMVMQLAARLFRLSYAEIWNMCTLNAAQALDLAEDRGSLEAGKRADVLLWSVPEHGMVINKFGANLVDTVIAGGQVVVEAGRVIRGELAKGAVQCP